LARQEISEQEIAFAEHYLKCWNGTAAARLANYSKHTARQQASRLLKRPVVKKYLKERMAELKTSADEVLIGLADHARGSMGDFLTIDAEGVRFDFRKAADADRLHLIKKFKINPGEYGVEYELELYDAQAAKIVLGKGHQLWTDKIDMTSGGKPINPIFAGLPDDDGGSDGAQDSV